MKTTHLVALFSSFLLILLPETTRAIPAFARKYAMSCITCHSPSPRLKAFGEEFAGNGFRLSDQEAPRYLIETGDGKLALIRDFPIAARMDAHLEFNNNNTRKTDFASPYLVKLLSGGELSKKLSYYFYTYFDERGKVVGVEDAYLFYNDLFGTELDIALGQFAASDPLFKSELRLTLEDYVIYKMKPGISNIALSYDRGIMITYGLPSGTDLTFEIVNGNGIGEADAAKMFDNDDYKNVAGRVSQSVGNWFRFGFFGYLGKELLKAGDGKEFTNQMYYLGSDITVSLNDIIECNLQYLYRSDGKMIAKPFSAKMHNDLVTQGGFAEIILTPKGDKSNWYMAGLVNWVDSGLDAADYLASTLHLGYLIQRNVRLVSEFTYDFTHAGKTYGKGSLGIVAAF